MKRSLLLIPLYALFFVLAFFFFVWLTFPWERVEQLVARKVETATGYRMTAEEFDSYWFTGLEATGVVLQKPLTASQRKAITEARQRAKDKGAAGKEAAGEEQPGAPGPKAAEGAPPEEVKKDGAPGEGQQPGSEGDGAGGKDGAGEQKEDPKSKEAATDLPQPPPAIRIPRLAARLALLPLLTGKLVVVFEGEAAGGTLEGRFGLVGEKRYLLELHAEGLSLPALPGLKEKLPVPLKGAIGAEAEVELALQEMSETRGKVLLKLQGAVVEPCEVPLPKGAMFPTFELATPTRLGNLELEIVVGEEQAREPGAALATVKRIQHTGGDLELKVEGDVVLTGELEHSRPDMTLGVRFEDGFVERNHLKMVLTHRDVKRYFKDDFLGVAVRGTVAHPDFKPVAPAWGKNRAYLRSSEPAVPEARARRPAVEKPARPLGRTAGGRPVPPRARKDQPLPEPEAPEAKEEE